jgi:AcrR family transcriptional regulator
MRATPGRKRKRGRPRDPFLPAKRREGILDAASAILARDGYERTDVQQVADALGVGKGTIYRYFPTKRSLFLGCVDRLMRGLVNAVNGCAEGRRDPLDRIAASIETYLVFHDRHPEFIELQIQERAEFKDRRQPTYRSYRKDAIVPWRRVIRRLVAQGRIRRIPVDRILDVAGDVLYGTIFTNLFSGRRKPLRAQARDILDILFRGILVPKERARRCR